MININNAADRGSADAYYGRKFNPHILVPNEHGGRVRANVVHGSPEYEAYRKNYAGENNKKNWGVSININF